MQVPDPRIDPQAWARLKPHVRDLLIRINRHPRPPMETLPVEEARVAYAGGSGVLEIPAPQLARIEDFTMPARDGYPMPARLYAATTEQQGVLPVLLFFHGGGFLVGSVDTHDTLCRALAQHSGCAVVSVDYRLGPEYKFPTAFEDAWDSLAWLHEHGAVRGLDGDHAGLVEQAIRQLITPHDVAEAPPHQALGRGDGVFGIRHGINQRVLADLSPAARQVAHD